MKTLTILVLTAGLLVSSVSAANPAYANGRDRGGNPNAQGGNPNNVTTDTSGSTGSGSSLPVCQVSHLTISGTEATRCIGSFEGNDAGSNAPNTVGLLNTNFGDVGSWSFVPSSNDGLFSHSGGTDDDWSLNSSFGGFQDLVSKNYSSIAIALKAANNFSLFTFEGDDLANLTQNGLSSIAGRFNTVGTATNPNGKAQGLSHMSFYVVEGDPEPQPPKQEVPEPFTILGLAVVGSIGVTLKRRPQ